MIARENKHLKIISYGDTERHKNQLRILQRLIGSDLLHMLDTLELEVIFDGLYGWDQQILNDHLRDWLDTL